MDAQYDESTRFCMISRTRSIW